MAVRIRRRWLTPEHDAVIDAARAFILEVDNPAPDLLRRSKLRDRLRDAVDALDGRKRSDAANG